jgi:hypothetical protein
MKKNEKQFFIPMNLFFCVSLLLPIISQMTTYFYYYQLILQAELSYQAEHLKQTIATTKISMLEKREAEEKAFSEEVSFSLSKNYFTAFFALLSSYVFHCSTFI